MKAAKIALFVLGGLAVLVGLVWIGQGSGYFPYPKSSFMIDNRPWIYWGTALAVSGIVGIFGARRL